MAQMTLEIPQALAELPDRERVLLLQAGLYEAWRVWMRQLEDEVAEAATHVHHFETRYGISLARFEPEILPTLETLQVHEDYNDWFFWQSVLADKQALLDSAVPKAITELLQ